MKISKKIEWIKPFIDVAEKKLKLNLSKLTEIKAIDKIPLDKLQPYYGLTTYHKGKYSITLCLHYHKRTCPMGDLRVVVQKPFSKIDILITLAHEIGHVVSEWEHTPRRQIMESMIVIIFMKYLEKTGYNSEEKELNDT